MRFDEEPDGDIHGECRDEIERLRSLLQNGSPVVEGTIQHMAMQLAACKTDAERLRETIATLNESLTITSQGNAKLREELAACKADAERYRWLRVQGTEFLEWWADRTPEEGDAAIDAAMKKEGE